MILEPLQVMVQLALLSQSPIGTKVSVSDNILQLHPPSYLQGVWRWYNSDGKDDLYYLFHAIRRYYKWYKSDGNRIYNYILTAAIKGLDRLIITYQTQNEGIALESVEVSMPPLMLCEVDEPGHTFLAKYLPQVHDK